MFSRATKASMLAGLLLSLLASDLFAAEMASDINVSRNYNDFKFSVGANLVSAKYKAAAESATAYSFSGEFSVLRGFALEGAYMDMGEVGNAPFTTKTNIKYFGLRGFKRLSLQFGLYGRAGLGLWNVNTSNVGSDSGSNILWGYGGEWRLTPLLNIRAGVDHINYSPNLNGVSYSESIHTFNLGVVFNFN